MKPVSVLNHKFVKGQTIFLASFDFFISVQKATVVGVIKDHHFEYVDPWGEFDIEWMCGEAVVLNIGGFVKPYPLLMLSEECTMVSTSSRSMFKFLKKMDIDVSSYNLSNNYYFAAKW